MPKIKLVVAGGFAQAEHWARELGWAREEWIYVSSRRQMYGYSHGTEIHLVGEWYRHPSQKAGHVDPDGSWCSEFKHLIEAGRLTLVEHDPDTGEILPVSGSEHI